MIFLCHPEATCLSSPKDLGAPRKSSALFADDKSARLTRFLTNCHSYQGGKSGAKHGQTWAIRAAYRVSGSDFHRLLDFSS
jgi:hypothetical protein